MKKKSLLFAAIPLLLFSVVGCNKSTTPGKVYLEYGKVHISESILVDEIDYDTLSSWIMHKNSFALAVSNEGCSCWETFQPILASFNYKYNLDIKQIPVKELNKDDRDKFGLYTVAVDSPFLAFFSNGTLIRQAMYGGNKELSKVFTDQSGKELEKFFFENAYLPKMLYVDKDTLDTYISENKDFNLYIARTGCGDCQTVNETMLRDWNKTTVSVDEPLYIFDIAPYYPGSEPKREEGESEEDFNNRHHEWETKSAIYQSVKDQYGLSSAYNKDLGYSSGMVPTFQHRLGNTIADMAVILNDGVYEDGRTMKSYYTSERVAKMPFLKDTGNEYVYDGRQLSNSEVTQYIIQGRTIVVIERETHIRLHTPILNRFLNTYVK